MQMPGNKSPWRRTVFTIESQAERVIGVEKPHQTTKHEFSRSPRHPTNHVVRFSAFIQFPFQLVRWCQGWMKGALRINLTNQAIHFHHYSIIPASNLIQRPSLSTPRIQHKISFEMQITHPLDFKPDLSVRAALRVLLTMTSFLVPQFILVWLRSSGEELWCVNGCCSGVKNENYSNSGAEVLFSIFVMMPSPYRAYRRFMRVEENVKFRARGAAFHFDDDTFQWNCCCCLTVDVN